MPSFKLVDAKLPEFGIPETRPELDSSIYLSVSPRCRGPAAQPDSTR